VNPEASAPFNLTISSEMNTSGGVSRLNTGGRTLQTYLVDNNGCIEFPVVGTLEVGGLTKSGCEKLIHDKIQRYMNAEENPIVTVRMSNYKISVLGEVNRPGMFTVGNEKINIFEALAQAGDLTIYGVRNKVKLIRENDKGKKEIFTLNLNDANIIKSPCYYLQQNDIVYVEPNKVKARNSSIGASTNLWFTGTSVMVSLATLIYTIFK
jgi:polysaccharide export outer membrane protein